MSLEANLEARSLEARSLDTSPAPTPAPTPSDILADILAETLAEILARSFQRAFPTDTPQRLAVACSGGSDSLALLLLCQEWAKQEWAKQEWAKQNAERADGFVTALICDHRQRASSSKECEALRRRLEDDFGLAAFVFTPSVPLSSYKGNLQQNMRLFRLQKMLDWCLENEVSHLALGHTRDDQLETHMLQEAGLLRGRGGMRELRRVRLCGQGKQEQEVFLLRPLLSASKASLRAWLQDREQGMGVAWLEDPSNASPRYARNRMRPLCARLSQAEQSRLLARCASQQEEERALEEAVRHFTHLHITWHAEGYACIESRAFLALDEKVALKVLAGVARSVGGKGVRTRQVLQVGRAWRACLESALHNSDIEANIENQEKLTQERDKQESSVLSLGRCLLFGKKGNLEGNLEDNLGDVFFATRTALRIESLSLTSALSRGALWDGRLRILAPLRTGDDSALPSASFATSFAGGACKTWACEAWTCEAWTCEAWTCEPLTREGIVCLRRCRRNLETREDTRKDAKLNRSLVRFESMPWRAREVMPSFWHEGKLRALPTLGIMLQGGEEGGRYFLMRGEGLPRVEFACVEERHLLLPT